MSALHDIAAQAWLFRAGVEHQAARRFERLAVEVSSIDPGSPVIEGLHGAVEDERRHFALCLELAQSWGARVPAQWGAVEAIAPAGLTQRQAVLYELTAACCVAETESMATLTSLLGPPTEGEVDSVLRAITRDEVRHAQLGWAHLARERRVIDVSFLGRLLPGMLAVTAGDALEAPTSAALDDVRLLTLGVMPRFRKRAVFVQALEEIVLPGFVSLGVNDGPARAWLAGATAEQPRAQPLPQS